MNRHGVEIGGFTVASSGKRVVVCATIDNLLKGAATQCLREFPPILPLAHSPLITKANELPENMNLALGFAEYEGIPTM